MNNIKNNYLNHHLVVIYLCISILFFIFGVITHHIYTNQQIEYLKEKAAFSSKIDHALQTMQMIADYYFDEEDCAGELPPTPAQS